ncbi:MAG TPA: hypothetical protein VGM02_06555 [Acidobacteriaceae bacterium]|jgi:hypothetical protein
MKVFWMWWKRCAVPAVSIVLAMGAFHANAQDTARVEPQATAEDVLASLVHHSAVIFAGEVYAIRLPQAMKGGVQGGLPSSRPDAVEIEFRVDMGIRGASIGSNYLLRMPVAAWQQAPPFTLHQRSVTFLKPADASGFSGPVEGEADIPGMDLGVMPVDSSNQVDLSRLQRLVTHKTITAASMLPPASGPAAQPPSVTDVGTAQGEDTLISGSDDGRMPELRNSTVPFLALVRDVSVLSGAENQQSNATAAGAPAK